jgi:DNA polymerase-3 subunit beta
VAVLTAERNKGVNVNLASRIMELTATHPDLGTARDSLDVDYDGEDFSMIINAEYLLDALEAVDTDEVLFEYWKEGAPLVIRPFPPKDYFNLVMPMRR